MIDYFGNVLLRASNPEDLERHIPYVKKTLDLRDYTDLERQLHVLDVELEVDLRECTSLTSLKGIGCTYLQRIGGVIQIPTTIISNMLGLLLVKDLKAIGIQYSLIQRQAGSQTNLFTFTQHPSYPMVGEMYYNSIHHQIYIYDGVSWLFVEAGAGATSSIAGEPKRLNAMVSFLNYHLENPGTDLLEIKEHLILQGFKEYGRL